jgi:glyoxylase-like metal-dependent hydrolase (beta-lactamase superfamily II)
VDCLVTESEARELAAWVKSLGPELSYVYITHPHGDHLMGLPEILDAFPNAKPVALAESMDAMQEQISPDFMQIWSNFFPGQVTSAPVAPGPLAGNTLRVGDTEINLVPVGGSDAEHSTVVHVPALDLIVSGDVVYNGTHMWFYLSTPESRANWAKALDAVASLNASTLIAGHRNPAAPDDDARRQISESQQYLAHFEESLARSATPTELIDRVMSTYPDWANPYTVWFAAYNLLGQSE